MEWISRDSNGDADTLSCLKYLNGYMLDGSFFAYLDRCLGPHTVDQFVSVKTRYSWTGFVADLSTLVVRLLMPSLSHGQGIMAISSIIPGFLCFSLHARWRQGQNPLSPGMAPFTLVAPASNQSWYMEAVCNELP